MVEAIAANGFSGAWVEENLVRRRGRVQVPARPPALCMHACLSTHILHTQHRRLRLCCCLRPQVGGRAPGAAHRPHLLTAPPRTTLHHLQRFASLIDLLPNTDEPAIVSTDGRAPLTHARL